ncbi:hypothetical protein K503DRAFT_78556 [Rhizopogon vinicolor AM-OR11-026]|uniref:Uncharacterized protein n=1 Tax=Rhizopogon vinicolor AM-OR11-026 TaxID=1314800 RepID=A0A1B7MFX7_9AGAM|nr:hypothetical protein K503DRAFT_78556 [Rhizopogon vinicolor AM-OR11-026]
MYHRPSVETSRQNLSLTVTSSLRSRILHKKFRSVRSSPTVLRSWNYSVSTMCRTPRTPCGNGTTDNLDRYQQRQFAPISKGCVLSLHFNVLSATRELPRYMFCLDSHHPR